MGIPEDAADVCLGNEAGEPIQVVEELEFGHRQSMTRIPQEGKSSLFRKSKGFYGFEVKNHPLESPKSQKKVYAFTKPKQEKQVYLFETTDKPKPRLFTGNIAPKTPASVPPSSRLFLEYARYGRQEK